MLLRKLSQVVLKNRGLFVALFVIYIAFVSFYATKVQLAFNGGKALPKTDSAFIRYNKFKQTFGEDGRVMVVGLQSNKLFEKDFLNDWRELSLKIKSIEGVEDVLSVGRLYEVQKDTIEHKFVVKPLFNQKLQSQAQADSVKQKILNMPFFLGLLYQPETNATLMAITFRQDVFNTPKRVPVLKAIERASQQFSDKHQVKMHYSGMPYIRTYITDLVSKEFALFLGLSLLVAMVVLGVFFRAVSPVVLSLLAVIFGVITSLASMSLFDYHITLLTGMIPPLMVVIGIPNTILLINKYHVEFKQSGDKIKALQTAMQRIGFSTLISNLTTAVGFGVLALTGSDILTEFGIVAALNVMLTYLLCLVFIPLAFSFLKEPSVKSVSHLDRGFLIKLLSKINSLVLYHRKWVYGSTIVIVLISLWGISKININGYVVDDLPKDSPLTTDLRFFEKHFEGALPFDISIDTKKKKGILRPNLLKKVNQLEEILSAYPEFSKPISLNSGLKYANQVFYGGDTAYYKSPSESDLVFLSTYLKVGKNAPLLNSFIDSNKQITRVSFQMVDAGSKRINQILEEVQPKVDSIFPPQKYQVDLTGSSVIFVKGNNYLLKNLQESLVLAIVLISLIMWTLFRGVKMIFISIIPNLIPLLITAAIMGFMGINLKPSTILIFSIALGIASDQTIYFLTRYRVDLKVTDWSVTRIIEDTLRETGVSMIYTAIILFFGFGIFAFSTFGGTVALGVLLSVTLVLAVVFNLTLLPALLLSLDNVKRKKQTKR